MGYQLEALVCVLYVMNYVSANVRSSLLGAWNQQSQPPQQQQSPKHTDRCSNEKHEPLSEPSRGGVIAERRASSASAATSSSFSSFSNSSPSASSAPLLLPEGDRAPFWAVLHHLLQTHTNAYAITAIAGGSPTTLGQPGIGETAQLRIAVAMFAGASLLNHSCTPNTLTTFWRRRVIIHTTDKIEAGSEVLNCYGPHVGRMTKLERQAALASQYFFRCTCCACTDDQGLDGCQQSSFRCPALPCTGRMQTSKGVIARCAVCHTAVRVEKLQQCLAQASQLLDQAMQCLSNSQVEGALACARRCLDLRLRLRPALHADVGSAHDATARMYVALGRPAQAAEHVAASVACVEAQFGGASVEVAREASKLASLLGECLMSPPRSDSSAMTTSQASIMSALRTAMGKALPFLQMLAKTDETAQNEVEELLALRSWLKQVNRLG